MTVSNARLDRFVDVKTSKKALSETYYDIEPWLRLEVNGVCSEVVAVKETWYPEDDGYPAEYQYELRGYELYKNGKRTAGRRRVSLGYDPDGLRVEDICKDYGIEIKT